MRQLLPEPLDEFDLLALEDRSDRIAPAGRPWVMANMVMSVDGAYALDGRSGGLGGAADRQVFQRLRGAADVILAAAGTARTERYRRPLVDDATLQRRRGHGRSEHPRLVLVSASLALAEDLPLFSGAGPEPLVLHPSGADTHGVPHGVQLRAVGDGDGVDLAGALEGLHGEGVEVVLCEGGPNLLGQLHAQDLLDELFVTVSPILVGGKDVGLLGQLAGTPRPARLHRLLEADGTLFATYRRA